MTENENNRPSFDGLPQSVAELHDKIDRLTETVEKLAIAIGTKPQNELMTVEDVSAMLCKSVSTIYTMTSEHRIPYRKQGNKLYFIRKEITAWLMGAVVPKGSPKRRRKEDADKETPQEKPSEEPPCSIEHRTHSRTGADLFAVLFQRSWKQQENGSSANRRVNMEAIGAITETAVTSSMPKRMRSVLPKR